MSVSTKGAEEDERMSVALDGQRCGHVEPSQESGRWKAVTPDGQERCCTTISSAKGWLYAKMYWRRSKQSEFALLGSGEQTDMRTKLAV